MIKSVVWSSMLDYPGEISTVLFVGMCKWNCSYCHNKSLFKNEIINFNKNILPKLIERKHIVNHIILSGGEPTDWPGFSYLLQQLKQNEFTVGIHTNGSNPKILEKNIYLIDYIGMDIKTALYKYPIIFNVNEENIINTINIISSSKVKYEFRTTLYPPYVNGDDCLNVALVLKKYNFNQYVLQQYLANDNKILPYKKEDVIKIQNDCNKIIPTIVRNL